MRNETTLEERERSLEAQDAPHDLRDRTKAFALRVVRLVNSLPRSLAAEVMGKQLLRSATSVGANYRAACRARSRPEFISRLGIAEEEADELISIIVASIRTARRGTAPIGR